jgi:hypothetical protein
VRIRRAVVAVALCAAALPALAGCGTGGGEPESGLDRADQRQLRDSLTSIVSPPPPSAVADYRRRRSDILVACMAKAGFSYVPFEPPAPPKLALGLSDEEFARRYGFGISTLIDYQPPGGYAVDPNAAVRRRLTPGARRTYQRALRGCEGSVRGALGVEPPEVAGGLRTSNAVGDRIREVAVAAEADERVVTAKAAYARCIARQGFRVATPEELTGPFAARAEPFSAAYWAQAARAAEAGGRMPRLADVLSAADLAALRRLQREELAAAAADGVCSGPLYKIVRAVHREYWNRALDGLD